MKRILGKLLKAIAVITLIPGILFWIAGSSAFLFRLFNCNRSIKIRTKLRREGNTLLSRFGVEELI
jgi:hypothetical protein